MGKKRRIGWCSLPCGLGGPCRGREPTPRYGGAIDLWGACGSPPEESMRVGVWPMRGILFPRELRLHVCPVLAWGDERKLPGVR